jgi:hypothetical protein
MAKTVLVPLQVAAKNVDSYNISAISSSDVENGQLFSTAALSTTAGESEVFTIATPATATLGNLYMAWSPEDVIVETADGNQYKVGDQDPRNFVNVDGIVFSAYAPQVGDKILITADGFTGALGGNTFAVAADGQVKLVWASAVSTGLSYRLLATSYISLAGGFGSQRVTAYLLECVL